jgi:uncharacterized protein YdaU (DUF1376 family)
VAHVDAIDKILVYTEVRDTRLRWLTTEHGKWLLIDEPMDNIWPAGDPCPRDKETLVRFLRKPYV